MKRGKHSRWASSDDCCHHWPYMNNLGCSAELKGKRARVWRPRRQWSESKVLWVQVSK
jgi:hypothetical protein